MCKDQEPVSGLCHTLLSNSLLSLLHPSQPFPDHKPLRLPALAFQPSWVFQGKNKKGLALSPQAPPHTQMGFQEVLSGTPSSQCLLSSPVVPLSWFAILPVTNCSLICLLTQTLSLRVFMFYLSCSFQHLPHSGEFITYLLAEYHRV